MRNKADSSPKEQRVGPPKPPRIGVTQTRGCGRKTGASDQLVAGCCHPHTPTRAASAGSELIAGCSAAPRAAAQTSDSAVIRRS